MFLLRLGYGGGLGPDLDRARQQTFSLQDRRERGNGHFQHVETGLAGGQVL